MPHMFVFLCVFFFSQRKKEYEIEMNRFLSVSFGFVGLTLSFCCKTLFIYFFNVLSSRVDVQTLSEEEQQRVLSEEKIGFKRGSGSTSPASKKKSSKTKVGPSTQHKDVCNDSVSLS